MNRKLLLIVLMLSMVFSSCNLPSAENPTPTLPQQSPETPGVILLISSPASGSTFPALSPIPVKVEISGEAQGVELWVDGEIVGEAQQPDFGLVRWEWVSVTPGMHTFQARATDETGNTHTSNSSMIWISDDVARFTMLYQPQDGDALTGLAERFNTSPEGILAANLFLPVDFSAPIPLDNPIKIPSSYPPAYQTEFSNLNFEPPQPGNLPGDTSPQTQFIPNAVSPVDQSNPFASEIVFVDKTYFYQSINGGPWSRVPRNQGEFFTPKNGFFDLDEAFTGWMQSAPSKDLHILIDAWGWQGGTLVFIGRFERIISATSNNEPWVILPGKLEICDSSTCPVSGEFIGQYVFHVISEGGNYKLRWQAPPGASNGLWQVSTLPFANDCELESAFLYSNGIVGSAGLDTIFHIDFPAYSGEETKFYVRVLPIINGQPDCTPSNEVMLTLAPPANVVLPTTQPPPPPPPVIYDIDITDFKPIHYPDSRFANCVTVVTNPKFAPYWSPTSKGDLLSGAPGSWYNVAPGTSICPALYKEDTSILGTILEGLKALVNLVSDLYNGLKQILVKLVAELNPFCLQAQAYNYAAKEGAGLDVGEDIESVCKAAAEIAVNAGLAYLGLPPSLPNYDELMEVAKGSAVDAMAKTFEEQTGIPCTDEEIIPGELSCKQLLRDGLDAVEAEANAQFKNASCIGEEEAHSKGIEPLCIPDDVEVVPMHEGQLEPAVITIQLTRRADAPDSALPDPSLYSTSCRVSVTSSAENNSWVGTEHYLGHNYETGNSIYWQGTALSGAPFETLSAVPPDLAPGESKTLTFALEANSSTYPPGNGGFWIPGAEEAAAQCINNTFGCSQANLLDSWSFLYFGSSITMNAAAICTTSSSASSSFSQATDQWLENIPAQEP
ncbi:MAG: hypothetical protein HYZ22_11480 [Chloroflexi bacterium]|nr:hypothetical protein [Chloroflexota bacterium]